ncbi:MAG TPA: glycosyltransferase family 39 protein [Aggregatilineales bacterium]|nr:glycosyltransferase family 39 protein [Aggregatilineales bacterium]
MMNTTRKTIRGLSLLTLIGAFGWLVVRWPHGGFWYDEALTTYVATDSWATLWRWCTQVDIQVPFHYVVLRLWSYATGDSEFTLRLLSVFSTLLTLAAMLAIGRRFSRGLTGIFAALLFVSTPGVLWVAYEVRAYALALALYAWATVFLLALIERGRRGLKPQPGVLVVYIGLMLAVLYTHYTGIAALASHVAILVIACLHTRSRMLVGPAILVIVAIGIGFAPWLPVLLARSSADRSYYTGVPIPPGRAVAVMLDFKLQGEDTVPAENLPVVWAYGGLVVLGLATGLMRPRAGTDSPTPACGALSGALIVLFPVVLTAAIVYFKPKLAGRYAWPAWIGADLLAGLAIAALWRFRRWIGVLALAGIVLLPWTVGVRAGPPDSDFRGAYATICAQGSPGDVILLRDGTLFVTARYYDHRCPAAHQVVGLPDALLTNVDVALTLPDVQKAIPPLLATHPPDVWVIAWQGNVMDPQAMIYALLDGTGPHMQQMFGDVQLDRYVNPRLVTDNPVEAGTPEGITPIAGGPTLLALRLIAPTAVHVGDRVVLQAWWQRGSTLQPDLRVNAQITTADGGYAYQEIVAPPSSWYYFDDRWPPGIPALGRYEFQIAPYMPDRVRVRYILEDRLNRWPPCILDAGEIAIQK